MYNRRDRERGTLTSREIRRVPADGLIEISVPGHQVPAWMTVSRAGEKSTATVGDEGTGSGQLTAQHSRAASAAADLSPLLALLQQPRIRSPLSPELNGVPAVNPPASASKKKMDVSHLFMVKLK